MTHKDYFGTGPSKEEAEREMYRVANEARAGQFKDGSLRYEVAVGVNLKKGTADADYDRAFQSAVCAARLGEGFVPEVHNLEVTAMGKFEAPTVGEAKPAGKGGGAAPRVQTTNLTNLF